MVKLNGGSHCVVEALDPRKTAGREELQSVEDICGGGNDRVRKLGKEA